MKRPEFLLYGAVAILCAATAFAMSVAPEADTDADGAYSLEEMQMLVPDLSEETFTVIDTDANGVLDDAELAAAAEAGVLPASDS